MPSITSPAFDKVKKTMGEHSGNIPVIIYCEDTGKQLSAPDSLKITASEQFFLKISEIVGKNNVKVVEN